MAEKSMFALKWQISDTMEKKKIGAGVCPPDSSLVIILLIVSLENCLAKHHSVPWEILYFFARVFFLFDLNFFDLYFLICFSKNRCCCPINKIIQKSKKYSTLLTHFNKLFKKD